MKGGAFIKPFLMCGTVLVRGQVFGTGSMRSRLWIMSNQNSSTLKKRRMFRQMARKGFWMSPRHDAASRGRFFLLEAEGSRPVGADYVRLVCRSKICRFSLEKQPNRNKKSRYRIPMQTKEPQNNKRDGSKI